ncbi:DeoR/GlpR family DNA-binding transcription regulator [Flexivirga lutea]
MLARQRQELIARAVEEHGGIRVSELVTELNVSDMTIRRDIETLARRGVVRKVHGGATRADRSADEPGFTAKSEMHQGAKTEIARTTAGLISPGSSVAVSAGTTAYAVAQALQEVTRLTVVTNSPRVADLLFDPQEKDRLVVLTGGVRTPSDALVGPVANEMLRTVHVDTLILGVHGIDLDAGLTTPNLQEAQTNRALIHAAKRVVVVADHSKWGIIGLSTIATLDAVDTLVTDAQLDEDARRAIGRHQVNLVVAARDDISAPGR